MKSAALQTTVGDRLGSTLFMAALAHGVLILGVTFGSAPFGTEATVSSLNVTLIVESRDTETAPEDAAFLAQRSQRGAGGAPEGERPTTAPPAEDPATLPGEPHAADLDQGRPAEAATVLERVATRQPNDDRIQALPHTTENPAVQTRSPAALMNDASLPTLAAEVDARTELPRNHERELVVSPSARESDLAAYLDSWRRRVERVGTANFPHLLPGDRRTRPALEVAIGADGHLLDVVILRSSGEAVLDQAALRILRMAMPFDPLPENVRSRYDVLRFAYEWDFSGLSATRASTD